jgi:hypothetical protein
MDSPSLFPRHAVICMSVISLILGFVAAEDICTRLARHNVSKCHGLPWDTGDHILVGYRETDRVEGLCEVS